VNACCAACFLNSINILHEPQLSAPWRLASIQSRPTINPSRLHDTAAALTTCTLRIVWIFLSVHLSPDRRYHVVSCLIAVVDQTHGCLSHFDARPLEVFFESRVELLEPSKFKICHALFFGLGIAPIPHRIWSWHVGLLQG